MKDPSARTCTSPSHLLQLDNLETTLQPVATMGPLGPCDSTTDIEVAFRHSGWQDRRKRVLEAFERIDPVSSRAVRFVACGRHAWVVQSVSDPGIYRVACSKCRDRLCVPCAAARGRRVAARVAQLSKNREVRFLTLTLRINHAPLGEQVTRLISCFARLRRRQMWKSTQVGGVAFLELKRRPDSHTWHPHIHAIVEGVFLDKADISDAWHQITGDSFVIKIKLCDSSERAAYYAAKYAGKAVHNGVENDPDMLEEAIVALKGRRLLMCFGNWSFPDDVDDVDPEEWRTIGTLKSVIEQAAAGDLSARTILGLLRGEVSSCTEPRSPPALGG